MAKQNREWYHIGYWRLSHRGRFIYDLVMAPIVAVLAVAFIRWYRRPTSVTGYWFVGVIIVISLASAAYNYSRWQAEIRDAKSDR